MSDTEFEIKINTEYAQQYEKDKKDEDIIKIKEQFRGQEIDDERLEKIIERKRKYGIDKEYDEEEGITIKVDDDEDSAFSDEFEDDNGDLVTPEVDSQILKTLVLIKTKNEAIYDSKKNFFDDEALDSARKELIARRREELKNKPVTLKSIQQEKYNKGKVDSSDDEDDTSERVITHEEEQRLLKENLKSAIDSQVKDDAEDSDEEFFMRRKKTNEEQDLEEQDYKQFLLEEMAKVDTSKEIFDQWASYKNNPQVSQDDAFLMDYVLNKGWIDKNVGKVPTYDEIVGEIEDEEQFEENEEFEKEYNFRFEEPGGIDIISYSRTNDDVIREKTSKRREARKRKHQLKNAKKLEASERLKRLKNEKMGELQDTLKELRRITGDRNLTIQNLEATLEKDSDVNEITAKLDSNFNSEHFNDMDDSNEKPVFDDDIDIGYIEALQSPEEAQQAKDAAKKLLEDYYNIDYEDKIDDLKTRFKYRQVAPSTGGLDVMDILLAEDKDLNSVVSLNKIAAFSTQGEIKPRYSKLRELRKKMVDEGIINPKDIDLGLPANSKGNFKPNNNTNSNDQSQKRKRNKKSN